MYPADGGRNKPTSREGAAPRSQGLIPDFLKDQNLRDIRLQVQGLPSLWRQSVEGDPSHAISNIQRLSPVLLHRSPRLSPWDCLVPFPCWISLSWVKQAATVKGSFLFPAASLEASCSDRQLLGHEKTHSILYGTALLPYQVQGTWWDCRHCSRASKFAECTGETTTTAYTATRQFTHVRGWEDWISRPQHVKQHQKSSGRCSTVLCFLFGVRTPVCGWIIAGLLGTLTCWIIPTDSWMNLPMTLAA